MPGTTGSRDEKNTTFVLKDLTGRREDRHMNIKPQILQGNAALMELSTECNKKMVPQSAWENYGRIV